MAQRSAKQNSSGFVRIETIPVWWVAFVDGASRIRCNFEFLTVDLEEVLHVLAVKKRNKTRVMQCNRRVVM